MLSRSLFYKDRSSSDGCDSQCKLCLRPKHRLKYLRNREKILRRTREYSAKHRPWINASAKARALLRNPEEFYRKSKAHNLHASFGMTLEQFSSLVAACGGKCQICRRPETNPRRKSLSIDHCHASGMIRGLLCSRCNLAIGLFRDDPITIRSAVEYLEKLFPRQRRSPTQLPPFVPTTER